MSGNERDAHVRSAGEPQALSSIEALAAESYESIASDVNVAPAERVAAATHLGRLNAPAAAAILLRIARGREGVKVDLGTYRDPRSVAIRPVPPPPPLVEDLNTFNARLQARIQALNALVTIEGNTAIQAIQAIATDTSLNPAVQTNSLNMITRIQNLDLRAAATMLHSVATASQVPTETRLIAANLLQQLRQRPR